MQGVNLTGDERGWNTEFSTPTFCSSSNDDDIRIIYNSSIIGGELKPAKNIRLPFLICFYVLHEMLQLRLQLEKILEGKKKKEEGGGRIWFHSIDGDVLSPISKKKLREELNCSPTKSYCHFVEFTYLLRAFILTLSPYF